MVPSFLAGWVGGDTLTPKEEARKFVKELRTTSSRAVIYAEIAGAQHAFDLFPSIRSEYCKLGIEHFVNYLYSEHLATQRNESSAVVVKLASVES